MSLILESVSAFLLLMQTHTVDVAWSRIVKCSLIISGVISSAPSQTDS